jgi:hypothetical protein
MAMTRSSLALPPSWIYHPRNPPPMTPPAQPRLYRTLIPAPPLNPQVVGSGSFGVYCAVYILHSLVRNPIPPPHRSNPPFPPSSETHTLPPPAGGVSVCAAHGHPGTQSGCGIRRRRGIRGRLYAGQLRRRGEGKGGGWEEEDIGTDDEEEEEEEEDGGGGDDDDDDRDGVMTRLCLCVVWCVCQVCGFLVSYPSLGAGMKWLQWLSYMKYSFQALAMNEFQVSLPALSFTPPTRATHTYHTRSERGGRGAGGTARAGL